MGAILDRLAFVAMCQRPRDSWESSRGHGIRGQRAIGPSLSGSLQASVTIAGQRINYYRAEACYARSRGAGSRASGRSRRPPPRPCTNGLPSKLRNFPNDGISAGVLLTE